MPWIQDFTITNLEIFPRCSRSTFCERLKLQRKWEKEPECIRSQIVFFVESNHIYNVISTQGKSRSFEVFWSNLNMYLHHPEVMKAFGGAIEKQDYFK